MLTRHSYFAKLVEAATLCRFGPGAIQLGQFTSCIDFNAITCLKFCGQKFEFIAIFVKVLLAFC